MFYCTSGPGTLSRIAARSTCIPRSQRIWEPLVRINERARSSPSCNITSRSEDQHLSATGKNTACHGHYSSYWKPFSLIVLLKQKRKTPICLLRGPLNHVRKLPVVIQSALSNRPRFIIWSPVRSSGWPLTSLASRLPGRPPVWLPT